MKRPKQGLGRGLGDLIQDKKIVEQILHADTGETFENLKLLKLSDVVPNPNQPRRQFDEETIEELATSIKEFGLIQPIVVAPRDGKYEIIAGERRYRAAKMINMEEIPAIIRETSAEEAAKMALIENVQREDLNPIDEAMAYKDIIDAYGITQQNLGDVIGKSRGYIGNTMRLLQLDPRVVDFIRDGKLSVSHGKNLLSLEVEDQFPAAERIIKDNLTVRKTAKTVTPRKRTRELTAEEVYLEDLSVKLMEIIGNRVQIIPGKDKGTLEIDFYGNDDLERILSYFGESWRE